MATTVARLNAVIGVNIDPLRKGIVEGKQELEGFADSAVKTGSKFGDAFAKIDHQKIKDAGSTMTVGMTLPLIAAGGAAMKMASSANEAANKVKVVFGESAKVVTEFAEKSATSFGMSGGEANKAAGTFGNLFNAIGLGTKPAADMSVSLLKLAADLASFNDIPIEEALEKLRAGLVGEAEPMRALGVLINEAAVETKALAMGLEQVDGKFTESAKVQARYALIMEQTKTAQGDFARTSGDLANATRGLEAEFKQLGEELGKELLPLAKDVVGVTLGLVKGFSELPKPVKDFGFGLGVVAAVAGPLVYTFGALVGLIKNIQAISITAGLAKAGLAIATGNVARNTGLETIALVANTKALEANALAAGRNTFAKGVGGVGGIGGVAGRGLGGLGVAGVGMGLIGGAVALGVGAAEAGGTQKSAEEEKAAVLANKQLSRAQKEAMIREIGWRKTQGQEADLTTRLSISAHRLFNPKSPIGAPLSATDQKLVEEARAIIAGQGGQASGGPREIMGPPEPPGVRNRAVFTGGFIPQLGYSSAQYRADHARNKAVRTFGVLSPSIGLYGQSQGGAGSVQTVSDGRPRIPSLPDSMRFDPDRPVGMMGGYGLPEGGIPFQRAQQAQAQLPRVQAAGGVQQIVLNVQPGASIQDILRLIQQQLERSSRALEYGPTSY